jgi:hypothetical protein
MTVSRDDMPSVDQQLDAADMSPQQRLYEIAAILADGVLRLRKATREVGKNKHTAPPDQPLRSIA